MRFFSIITAILVAGALYLLVFERDRVSEFAGAADDVAVEPAAAAPAAEDVQPATEDGVRRVSVVAIRSEAQEIDNAVMLRGQTEAARQVDIRAETSGLVESEPLRKGSYVERGQVMCKIDPGTRETDLALANARLPEAKAKLPEAEGRLAEAQALLEEARINDNAAQKLSRDGFASDTRVASTRASVQSALAGVETAKAAVQSAMAGVQSAEAAISSAEKEIDRLTIKAPFSGLLETDTAELGALLQPGSLCANIIQLNPIKLVAFVPETEVANVAVGASAVGRTTAGQELQGQVTFLSRSSDPETRTFRVEITVSNEDLGLRDGQTAEIMIGADGKAAHLLPASALTLDDSGTLGVRVAVDNKAAFAPITILQDTTEGVWVSGLDQTAEVIVVGQEYVTDGVQVDVTYREEGT
ncbi:efflux RND transporter periplasmic adaptor subunit [Litoreibacter roseus]|uniref:Hemolysin D n=1 Tax=Litoreibacter roseus TaxID=2601869 RepID=A0A6N6JD21_9RHOB|nr:efflux RND transporter periplasmic adaptor subunit [Litoreibacter roseus]GFE64004.1 hemolysin D [Litoreibacter roseus]